MPLNKDLINYIYILQKMLVNKIISSMHSRQKVYYIP